MTLIAPALTIYGIMTFLIGAMAGFSYSWSASRDSARVILTCWAWPVWGILVIAGGIVQLWKDADW